MNWSISKFLVFVACTTVGAFLLLRAFGLGANAPLPVAEPVRVKPQQYDEIRCVSNFVQKYDGTIVTQDGKALRC